MLQQQEAWPNVSSPLLDVVLPMAILPDEPPDIPGVPSPVALAAVERFDGDTDAHAWLRALIDIAQLYNWPDHICLTVASLRLTGSAQTWLQSHHIADWAHFEDAFLTRFAETRETALCRLETCCQQLDESPQSFADRYLHDFDKTGRTVDETAVYSFIKRLQPELRAEAARHQFATIDDVVSFCNYWLLFTTPSAGASPVIPCQLDTKAAPALWNSDITAANTTDDADDWLKPGASAHSSRYDNHRDPTYGSLYRPAVHNLWSDRRYHCDSDPQPYRPHPAPSAVSDANALRDFACYADQWETDVNQQAAELDERDYDVWYLRHVLQPQVWPEIAYDSDIQCLPDGATDALYLQQPLTAHNALPIKQMQAIDPCFHSGIPRVATVELQVQGCNSNTLADVAAHTADAKARLLAAAISTNIANNALEATVSRQAILTCLAGHLMGDPDMIELGRNLACRADAPQCPSHCNMPKHRLPHHMSTAVDVADVAAVTGAPDQVPTVTTAAAPDYCLESLACDKTAAPSRSRDVIVSNDATSSTASVHLCPDKLTDSIAKAPSVYADELIICHKTKAP